MITNMNELVESEIGKEIIQKVIDDKNTRFFYNKGKQSIVQTHFQDGDIRNKKAIGVNFEPQTEEWLRKYLPDGWLAHFIRIAVEDAITDFTLEMEKRVEVPQNERNDSFINSNME